MLQKCKECGLPVSDKAISCPHCGYPLKPEQKYTQRRSNKRRRLPNGFGQISEIKGQNLRKPFRAMITVGKNEYGKPICKLLKPEAFFETYNDAYAALVEYNRNPYDLNPAITMEELHNKWYDKYTEKLTAESTIRGLKQAWKYCSSIYKMRVCDVRARHIKGCIEEGNIIVNGQKTYPTAFSKTRIKSMFNQMFDYAVEYELAEKNYARTFTLPNEIIKDLANVKKEHMSFAADEIDRLWANVYKKEGVDAILLQCYSGWRPQEVGLIKLADVDLKNNTMVGGIKTLAGTNRIVPIHSRIKPIVEKRYKEAKEIGSEFLFNCTDGIRNRTDYHFTYKRYSRMFDRVISELNLDKNHRPHDGRTHFVTIGKKYGMDEYAIKYIVGHKINDLTERVYTKREIDWLKQEIEKIK